MNIFPLKLNDIPIGLQQQKQNSSCSFILKKKSNQSKGLITNNNEIERFPINLAIIGNYIVEKNHKTQQIVSAFLCDYQVKYKIIRQPTLVIIYHYNMKNQNTIGQVQGITFEFPQLIQYKFISLYLDQQNKQINIKKFNHFYQILKVKFIVQLDFQQQFKAEKRIGKGVTACVYSAISLATDTLVAIKSIKKQQYFKDKTGKNAFLKQFKTLTILNCKYLSKLNTVYQSQNTIYIVMQILDRTLYNYLQIYNFPPLPQCKKLLYKLLIGVKFLHIRNLMHRDLKLENIMLKGSGKQNIQPIIIDFGLAEYQNAENPVFIRCGTPGYVAPQVINHSKQDKKMAYNKKCDIFSLGVIFHIMLLGKPVFQGHDVRNVIQLNKQCYIDPQFPKFPNLPQIYKNLLIGMLKKQYKQRFSIDQILNHQFFKQQKLIYYKQVQQIEQEYKKQNGLNKIQYQQNNYKISDKLKLKTNTDYPSKILEEEIQQIQKMSENCSEDMMIGKNQKNQN